MEWKVRLKAKGARISRRYGEDFAIFFSFLISEAHNLMRIKKNGMTARPSVKGAVYGEGSPGFLGCFFLPRLLASREKKNNNKLSKLKVQPFTGQTHRLGVKNSNA